MHKINILNTEYRFCRPSASSARKQREHSVSDDIVTLAGLWTRSIQINRNVMKSKHKNDDTVAEIIGIGNKNKFSCRRETARRLNRYWLVVVYQHPTGQHVVPRFRSVPGGHVSKSRTSLHDSLRCAAWTSGSKLRRVNSTGGGAPCIEVYNRSDGWPDLSIDRSSRQQCGRSALRATTQRADTVQ